MTKHLLPNNAINADLMNVVDLALQQAWADVRARPSMMPWETNSWLNEVLGSGVPLRQPLQINLLIPPMPVPTASTTVKAVTASASASGSGVLVMASGPAFCRAVKRLADVEWKQEKTDKRDKALQMWRLILVSSASCSITGRQLLEECASLSADCNVQGTISDTFEKKATRTLEKRAGSILRYMNWCATVEDLPVCAWPVTEFTCYRYLCWLRDTDKAPSVGNDFRSALAFCHGVIGCRCCST